MRTRNRRGCSRWGLSAGTWYWPDIGPSEQGCSISPRSPRRRRYAVPVDKYQLVAGAADPAELNDTIADAARDIARRSDGRPTRRTRQERPARRRKNRQGATIEREEDYASGCAAGGDARARNDLRRLRPRTQMHGPGLHETRKHVLRLHPNPIPDSNDGKPEERVSGRRPRACPSKRILVGGDHDSDRGALEDAGVTVQHRNALSTAVPLKKNRGGRREAVRQDTAGPPEVPLGRGAARHDP